jgi:hypothetical protein
MVFTPAQSRSDGRPTCPASCRAGVDGTPFEQGEIGPDLFRHAGMMG